MALSDAGKAVMLDALGAIAAYASIHTGDPGTTGANEASGGSPAYTRKAITWAPAANGELSSSNAQVFDVPAGTYSYFGLWSDLTNGTFYGGNALSSPETFAAQGTYTLSDVDVEVSDTVGPSTWPDATNTGYSGSLTLSSGNMTVDTDGSIIENLHITGRVTVEAANVTIRNCFVDNPDDYYVILTESSATNLLVEDCTLLGGLNAQGALSGSGVWVARRLNVYGAADGVRLSDNCELYDSYIHDLGADEDTHNDGVTADGFTGWTIQHNTIYNPNSQTSCVWVGDPRYDPGSGTFADNLIAGGGYAIYAGPATASGLYVTGNHFSTLYYPDCGYYGYCASWSDTNTTWSGNVWHDGPQAGQPVPEPS